MHHVHLSVFTQSCTDVTSDVSFLEGDHGLRCLLLLFGLSSIVFPQSAACFTFYPEVSEMSHEMLVKEKTEGSRQRFLSGHVFLNHCLKATRGAMYLTFSAGHGWTSQVLNDAVVGFVTYFTIMHTVVFLLDSILLPLKACGTPQGSVLCPSWFLNYSLCFL